MIPESEAWIGGLGLLAVALLRPRSRRAERARVWALPFVISVAVAVAAVAEGVGPLSPGQLFAVLAPLLPGLGALLVLELAAGRIRMPPGPVGDLVAGLVHGPAGAVGVPSAQGAARVSAAALLSPLANPAWALALPGLPLWPALLAAPIALLATGREAAPRAEARVNAVESALWAVCVLGLTATFQLSGAAAWVSEGVALAEPSALALTALGILLALVADPWLVAAAVLSISRVGHLEGALAPLAMGLAWSTVAAFAHAKQPVDWRVWLAQVAPVLAAGSLLGR